MHVETNCIEAPQARVLTSAFSADRAAPTQENHHRRQEAFVFDDVAFGFCSAFVALELKMQEVWCCCGVCRIVEDTVGGTPRVSVLATLYKIHRRID